MVVLSLVHQLWRYFSLVLTHWGRVTHICICKLTIIGSDNGLSPGWHQANIRTCAWILLTRILGRKFSEILFKIYTFSFKKMLLKMMSGKWRPFCLDLNVLSCHNNTSPRCCSAFAIGSFNTFLSAQSWQECRKANSWVTGYKILDY